MIGHTVSVTSAPQISNTAAISEKFDQSSQITEDAYERSKSAITELQSYLLGLEPLELLPAFNSPEFVQYVLARGERPVAPTIDFPSLTVPDLDVPIPGFSYSDSPYSSELREALRTKLKDGVEDGGSGLGADVEDAIYSRNEIRDEQALQDRLDAMGDDWSESAAGDLGLPDGALLTARRRLHQEYLAGRQTASKDISTKMSELARQQEEVYIREGNQFENVTSGKHTADQGRALEAAKVEPEIIIRTFEAAMSKVKVYAEIYNALAAKTNAMAQIFRAQMDGYVSEAEIGAKELAASTQKYDSDVKAEVAKAEASWRTDSNKVEQVKNFLALRTDSIKAIMQVAAQMMAAALTSVNASVSMGLNQSSSFSESKSDSSSTSYSNTYDASE